MTAKLQTSIVRLINATIEQASQLDPNEDLELTHTQRQTMDEAAASAFEAEADKILAPYGCTMLGNGDIICTDVENDGVLEWDEEAVREEIAGIDVSEVLENFTA